MPSDSVAIVGNWLSPIRGVVDTRLRSRGDPMTRLSTDYAMRQRALEAHMELCAPLDCRTLWSDLVTGNSKVVDGFFSDDRCYLVISSHQGRGAAYRPRARDLTVLESVTARGNTQKVMSIELGISASSVAGIVRRYLEFLGVCCQPSRMPVVLVMVANASLEGQNLEGARCSPFEYEGVRYQAVSTPRPEATIASLLSPAEYAIVGLLLEGRDHAQIAACRNTSRRTIANQLASAFQRVGVSGRTELMHALALRSHATAPWITAADSASA